MTTWPSSGVQLTRPDRPLRTRLVHRQLDAWLIGGASIVVFALMFILVPKNGDVGSISITAFYLAFLVNGPHFFASYWHLYVDNASQLFKNRRYIFAGFVVPVVLLGALFVAAQHPNTGTLAFLISVMYLSVGWHYVKQIFGVTLVSSAAHGSPITGIRKKLLRVSLLSVWLMSWGFSNQRGGQISSFGVTYDALNITRWLKDNWTGFFGDHIRVVIYALVIVSTTATIGSFIHQWIKTGRTMAFVGWVAYASIFVWYLPVFYHASYFYLVPFFHSLQYLLFSVTFSWNKAHAIPAPSSAVPASALPDRVDAGLVETASVASTSDTHTDVDTEPLTIPAPLSPDAIELADQQRRKAFVLRFGAFVAFACIAGAAGFHWLPEYLDRNQPYRTEVLGAQFWLAAFNLFINIHHYFVDSVIWRGTNPQMRAFLKPKPA